MKNLIGKNIPKRSIGDVKKESFLKYNIIYYNDIADVLLSHKKIFKVFEKIRKDVFEPNDRIILYSSKLLEQKVLDHIQRAAIKIDISNFFILIYNNQDISEKLKLSNKKYGYDSIQIQNEVINFSETKKINSEKIFKFDAMCPFPFAMATIQHETNYMDMKPCCKFNGSAGNLNEHDFLSLFFGDKFNLIREKMKNGERPVECKTCWDDENKGTTSFRQLGLLKYEKLLDHGWLDSIKVRDITISPSNICNFKCRICSYYASSAIATEKIKNSVSEKEIKEIKNLLKTHSSNKKNQILEILDKASHSVEFLHILGGEPFMYPHLQESLDVLIKNKHAKNISLEFNTNGSIFPGHLINKFDEFKSVEILLSIDDIGKRFEIQRGGSWEKIVENIKKFNNIASNKLIVKAAITVNIQNVIYLDKIYNFFRNNGMDIVWWYLESPSYYCIDNINEKTQNKIIEKYSQHPEEELRNIAERVKSNNPVQNKKFLEECKEYDIIRNQNFSLYHKEIIDLMSDE